MPIAPDAETNYFLGLSDFWTRYFLDTKQVKTIYDATQTLIGQQYLDLLSDVLAVSLHDIPLFSKKYFHYFPFREDQVVYVEGSTPSSDRWVVSPREKIARADVIMNRVLAPTSLLEWGRDFELSDGNILFKANPFQINETPLPGFALRTLQVLYDYAFSLPEITDWSVENVQTGDTLRIYPSTQSPIEFEIRLVDTKLGLARTEQLPTSELRATGFTYAILRVPFDAVQKNVELCTPSLTLFDSDTKAATIPGTWQMRKFTGGIDYRSYDLAGKYVWVADPVMIENQGLYRIRRTLDADTLEIDRPLPFVESTAIFNTVIYDYSYAPDSAPHQPTLDLQRQYIVEGTLRVNGVRAVELDSTHLAGGMLEEGVDYTVNYDTGIITCLTPVEVGVTVGADYEWRLLAKSGTVLRARPWRAGTLYEIDSVALNPLGEYVRALNTHFSGSAYVADTAHWHAYTSPVETSAVLATRELGTWIPDAEVDDDRLYSNFGFLLGIKRPSSEGYRTLLEGIAQLFLLGPSFSHLESALNAMAGLPLIRDNGEILQSYDTGVTAQGTSGRLEDVQYARNGDLTTIGKFVVTGGNFKADDALTSIVKVTRSIGNDYHYVISEVISPNEVQLSPPPFIDEADTGFYWTHEHAYARRRFTTDEFEFAVSDIGGYVAITEATNQKNLGAYLIEDFVNQHCVVLRSDAGFYDEENVSWTFTRNNEQRIVTDRRTYKLPYGLPLKELSVGQVFQSFDAISDVFSVVDYVVTPTWWHGQVIPTQLLELVSNDAGRRHATPVLIRHETNAVDSARIGDPGLIIGADDEGRPAEARNIEARWTGSDYLIFNSPQVDINDVGQYLHIEQTPSNCWLPNTSYSVDTRCNYSNVEYCCTTAHTSAGAFNGLMWTSYRIHLFVGDYRINSVSTDGIRATLDDFPTAAMITEGTIPDGTRLLSDDVLLPPRLYRRTVGFVVMDRFLKYHTMQVKINAYAGLSPDFISTIAATLQDARPNYAYLFINPIAKFAERLEVSDTLTIEVV